jgi:hypothetical protein
MPDIGTCYRVYCGLNARPGERTTKAVVATNRLIALTLADKHLDGYTAYETQGRWQGDSEPTLVFEVVTNDPDREFIVAFCQAYKLQANQEAVFLTEYRIHTESF